MDNKSLIFSYFNYDGVHNELELVYLFKPLEYLLLKKCFTNGLINESEIIQMLDFYLYEHDIEYIDNSETYPLNIYLR